LSAGCETAALNEICQQDGPFTVRSFWAIVHAPQRASIGRLNADTAAPNGSARRVLGSCSEIDTELMDEDKYILRVGTGDEWEFFSVDFYDIGADSLSSVDKGDKVTVVGEFSDGGDLGVTVRIARLEN
jgi:hypothetical protein